MPLTFTLLGTGTSAGVPLIGCHCDTCSSTDPRDNRLRPGAMVQYADPAGAHRCILIDTTPDLRQQMLRHRVDRIDGVVYTHTHADHIFGVDDLRRFNAVMKSPIHIYGEDRTLEFLRHTFSYIFDPLKNINKSFVATLIPNPVCVNVPFEIHGRPWLPIRLLHGRIPVAGFRIGKLAYCTDCSAVPPESFPHLYDLDVLVIDALRYRHHPTHLTVDQALALVEQLKPRRTYFTHIAHEIKHSELEARLPDHVQLGHDGLTIQVPD